MNAPDPQPFAYPTTAHEYRHGPGYNDYESCRPWLRDEFDFRCVYCLFREQWCPILSFHLDHFIPQAVDESRSTDFGNLVYSCPSCNSRKSAKTPPHPGLHLRADTVTVKEDGTIEGHTDEARRIIRQLDLDAADYNEFRETEIANVALARERTTGQYAGQYQRLMGYPKDLPDLARLRPPTNTRPEGVQQSAYARRQRGELPDVY